MNRTTLSSGAVGLLVVLTSACIPIETTHREAAVVPAAPIKTASGPFKNPEAFHPDDLVCRTYDVTGTRIGKQRICKTREQWAQAARDAQEAMSVIERQSSTQPGGETLGPANPYPR